MKLENSDIKKSSIDLTLKADELLVITSNTSEINILESIPNHILCIQAQSCVDAFTEAHVVTTYRDIPVGTYLTIGEDDKGWFVLFCLSHGDMTVSLKGIEDGIALHINYSSEYLHENPLDALLCFRSDNLYHTIHQAMKHALTLTGGMGKLLIDKLPQPSWLDSLGWESGISMSSNVSHQGIIDAVRSLVVAGCSPEFVLIDEGWQDLEADRMASFEANSQRFPSGLRGVVDDLAELGIRHVGVWHGMMGYRGGVAEHLARKYNLPVSKDGRYYLGKDLGRSFEFYFDFYGYLRQQGVAFVKVGDQGSVAKFIDEASDSTTIYRNLQSTMQAAASIQFNSTLFNTECLRNENLFYWGISRIARTAGDINILNPSGVTKAIRNNLVNSLWLQHLMQPDFDAWLTNGEYSEMLAIYHALSGSINVIGDPVGEHDKALINKFLLPDGHLIMADRPLTLCIDSVFINPLDEKKAYKAFTFKGEHGIIAAFNLLVGKRTVHGHVVASDVEGIVGERFALFSHHNGFIKIVHRNELVAITLKPGEADVFTFAPLVNGIAVLGCYPFFLAPGPILEVNIEDDAMHISTRVASGIIIYSERQILEVRRNGRTIPWEYDSRRQTLSIDSRACISSGHAAYTITFES